jgi:uncharacterized FAD-dependent dehydrogenase
MGGGDYSAPAQTLGDFLQGKSGTAFTEVLPSCTSGATPADVAKILPRRVTETLRAAIPQMARSLRGFDNPAAVLTAPETRSSSPVRVPRDEFWQANIRGLFPCGEGAGYAGGIVSAAVDGIRGAWAVLEDER